MEARPAYPVTDKKARALNERLDRLEIREADLEESFVKGGGSGGQKINKTSVAVRLIHRPSGVEVKTSKHRSRALNRYEARKLLCDRLETLRLGEKSPAAKKAEKIRKQKARRRRRSSSGN